MSSAVAVEVFAAVLVKEVDCMRSLQHSMHQLKDAWEVEHIRRMVVFDCLLLA
jgi:hypothetical protein